MRLDYIRKVKSMAKNDYYVIVYRVLMYLYNCLRQDEVVDMQKLTPEYLHINQRYFEYIFDTLNDEGLILNKAYYEDMLGKHLESDIMISPKGISFLLKIALLIKSRSQLRELLLLLVIFLDYNISTRSEEHTSELQSRFDLVCRLLLE